MPPVPLIRFQLVGDIHPLRQRIVPPALLESNGLPNLLVIVQSHLQVTTLSAHLLLALDLKSVGSEQRCRILRPERPQLAQAIHNLQSPAAFIDRPAGGASGQYTLHPPPVNRTQIQHGIDLQPGLQLLVRHLLGSNLQQPGP